MKRSTVVAFAVLVVLAGVVYWLERRDAEDVERVFAVEEDDILRVEIRSPSREPVIIERRASGDECRVVEPITAACDGREVELVVSNLATMSEVRSFTLDEQSALEEFGLDAPKLEIRFTTRNGDEHGLSFGNDTLTPSNQYAARLVRNEVLVVPSYLSNNLDKSAWDLRDKAIFHIDDEAEPERVSISRGDETLVLATDSGVWMTAGPPRARVDRFDVAAMVRRFREAEMLELAEASAEHGLDPPAYRLDVEFREREETISLEIGNKKNVDYYARAPSHPRVFVIEGGLVTELQKGAREWWSRKLLHHATTEATEVHIETPSGERTLDRDEADELLRVLSDVTAEDLLTSLPSGDPAVVITVTTEAAEDAFSIHLEDDVAFAVRTGEDIALRLPREGWEAIEAELPLEAR